MKRLLLFFLPFVILSLSALSQMESEQPAEISTPIVHEVMVQGGLSFPYLPTVLRDTLKSGWCGGVGYSISLPPGEMGYSSLFIVLDYNNFKGKGNVAAKSFTAMVNFKGTFVPTIISISPYFSFGVGYMFYSSDSIEIDKKRAGGNKHTIGWNLALGVELPITDQFVAYLQGQSVVGFLEKSRQYFPVNVGIRFRVL